MWWCIENVWPPEWWGFKRRAKGTAGMIVQRLDINGCKHHSGSCDGFLCSSNLKRGSKLIKNQATLLYYAGTPWRSRFEAIREENSLSRCGVPSNQVLLWVHVCAVGDGRSFDRFVETAGRSLTGWQWGCQLCMHLISDTSTHCWLSLLVGRCLMWNRINISVNAP